jgi:hypothetical protein
MKAPFSTSSLLLSCYFLAFLILTTSVIPFTNLVKVFAQNNSRPDNEIFVCNLVQYCSNPIVINTTLTQSDVISQTSTNSTIPEVVSNISIMMTPDLYNDLAR